MTQAGYRISSFYKTLGVQRCGFPACVLLIKEVAILSTKSNMNTMYNEIYLQQKLKWIIEPSQHHVPVSYLASAIKNIEGLGFTFSKPLIEALRTLSIPNFIANYRSIEAQLKRMVKANYKYKPMYPNFPEQVMEMDEAELYLNAIYHYYTLLMPDEEAIDPTCAHEIKTAKINDKKNLTKKNLRVIDLGDLEQFYEMIQDLMSAKTSISSGDKELIELVIMEEQNVAQLLPSEIPLKENVAFIAGLLLKYGKADVAYIGCYFKTATDVLRLAVALSEGDVSLADNTKFRKFKRSERRLLLGLLNQCHEPLEDMLRYKERWIRLGEIIHPSEYKKQYPQSAEAFDSIRNGQKIVTFRTEVEQALRYHNTVGATYLLAERPGEFARRLDHLLRTHPSPDEVVFTFSLIVKEVSTPVLLQVMTHFNHRNHAPKWRTFFPKGSVGKAIAIPNTLPKLTQAICSEIVSLCQQVLIERFSTLEPLGKVFIADSLQKHHVPFGMRSASKSLRTLTRGSRIAMPQGNTIRFFLWWKEGKINGTHSGRVDIDLSAIMYNKKWEYMEHISYTNLRSSQYKAYHSGDIVSAPQGACEFIDIDIDSVLQYGGRYVVSYLNSFTLQAFCDLPECFAGWMMRSKTDSKEVFDPKTVVDVIDLAADTQIAIPVILDLFKREVIWCDLALRRHPAYYNNVEGNLKGMMAIGQAMTSVVKPNLYDLFQLHATARGEVTSNIEDADTVFSMDEGITPFDTGTIVGQYL